MKQMKKLLCGLLMVCMMLTGIGIMPQTVQAKTASGNDGEIHWKIKGDTLTLSAVKGTKGRMKDYSFNHESPWSLSPQMKSVKNVVLDESVTEISSYAFASALHKNSQIGKLDTMKIFSKADVIPEYFIDGPIKEINTIIIGGGIKEIKQFAFPCTCTKTLIVDKNVIRIGETNFGASFGHDGYATELKNVYGYSGASKFVSFWNKGLALEYKWFMFDSDGDGVEDKDIVLWRPNENGTNGFSLIKFSSLNGKNCLSKVKAIASISVNKGKSKALKLTLPAGFTQVAKYTGSPDDVKVTFKSSNPKVATVSSSGKVTGKKKGTAKISISMQIKNGAKKTLTTKIIVK